MTLRMLRRIKDWARAIRRDVHALWLAARDRRTPWYAEAFALAIAAYALSPIDLIPDFIPVLGYLDEVILLPLAIMLAVRLVPPDLMAEHRATARAEGGSRSAACALPIGRRSRAMTCTARHIDCRMSDHSKYSG
jgi:uncharacterized membrane protein YkvA (DUF1232 family)